MYHKCFHSIFLSRLSILPCIFSISSKINQILFPEMVFFLIKLFVCALADVKLYCFLVSLAPGLEFYGNKEICFLSPFFPLPFVVAGVPNSVNAFEWTYEENTHPDYEPSCSVPSWSSFFSLFSELREGVKRSHLEGNICLWLGIIVSRLKSLLSLTVLGLFYTVIKESKGENSISCS